MAGLSNLPDKTAVESPSELKQLADFTDMLNKRDDVGEIRQYQPDNPNSRRTFDSLTPREKQDDLMTYAEVPTYFLGSGASSTRLARPVVGNADRFGLYLSGEKLVPATVTKDVPYTVEEALTLPNLTGMDIRRVRPGRFFSGQSPYYEYVSTGENVTTRSIRPKAKYYRDPYNSKIVYDKGYDRVSPDFESMGKRTRRATGPMSTEIYPILDK